MIDIFLRDEWCPFNEVMIQHIVETVEGVFSCRQINLCHVVSETSMHRYLPIPDYQALGEITLRDSSLVLAYA